MATVACPGCGLPRVESELNVMPCPVCESASAPEVVPPPRVRVLVEPDRVTARSSDDNRPTTSLPAARSHTPRLILVSAAFVLGTAVGVGGVLGLQSLTHKPPEQPEPVERTVYEPIRPPAALEPLHTPVAPMPRERTPIHAVETAPPPRVARQSLPPGRITTVELNEPDATYVVPIPLKKGEHVVLRGKVKALRVTGLDLGAVLDATGLEAETINIGARIDGRSTLKLNAPNGVVHFGGWVGGGSVVEVNAPGGEVKFVYPTTDAKPGSKIDGGAAVSITSRFVEFKGDITGTDTFVSVTLTRNAWLKLASVRDHATVEYRSQPGVRSEPDVTVGTVAPTAKLRKE